MNYNKLHEIKYSQVKPTGWLRETLLAEKNGMPGHLHQIGYPYNTSCWEYKRMTDGGWEEWWPYEQMAYWIDSIVRTAGLLEDEEFYGIVKKQIDAALSYEDSFIGPEEIKEHKSCYRWPIALFARALYARWSLTGDTFYLEKLRDHYLNDTSDYSGLRDIVNIETMFRLYEYFGDERLRGKAIVAYEKFDRSEENTSNAASLLSDSIPVQHGVTFNEQAKLAAIMYSYTGKKQYLDAAIKGYEKIDQYHMLPDGVHSSCETTRGNETKWAHESCDITDFTWSMGYLLEATGSSIYADKIERAILNAAFGAIGPYFRTIQYFSEVNQVIAARNSTNIEIFENAPRMAFQPHHYPECCVGNIGRAFPNYVFRMYQKYADGICLSLYGDSIFEDENVKLIQTGGYPFGDTIRVSVTLKNIEEISLKLRIPYWACEYSVTRNKEQVSPVTDNGYLTVKVWNADEIELNFKKEFVSKESPDGGVYFEYGPFLLALKIDEKWEIDESERRQTQEFPAYNVYPVSAWNYCVSGNEIPEVEIGEVGNNPFWDGIPYKFHLNASELHNWSLVRKSLQNSEQKWEVDEKQIACGATEIQEDLVLTPELPNSDDIERNKGDLKKITLVPYGCTNLRVTVFPTYL